MNKEHTDTREILPEVGRPAQNLPYQDVHNAFKLQFLVPGKGIQMRMDTNGVCYISTEGGESVTDIVAGDNIELTRTEDGKIVISAVNSVTNVTAGENVTIDIDPETGDAIINSVIDGTTNEHYQGVFDTPEDLIEYDTNPDSGDYGLIKNLVISNGETSWNGQYKYCFYINGQWTVVDQMLTFTKDTDLLQQYYSVGGSSPVIYLHEIARSGDFNDLRNVPIVATPEVTVEGQTVTVTCATEGAEIWYTTDGSMPHVNGTKYTGPITVSGATDFRFVGIKNGMINSLEATASADYGLEAPEISLDWHDGTVTMTNPNEDGNGDPVGVIMYSTDNGNVWHQYVEPFAITSATDFKLFVLDSDNSVESEVVVKSYGKVMTPRNNAQSSSFITGNASASLYCQTENSEIHYTTDNSTPTYLSDKYEAAIAMRLYEPVTVKAKGYAVDMVPSDLFSKSFEYEKPSTPEISYDSNTGLVTLSRTGETVSINIITTAPPTLKVSGYMLYTLDGTTPTKDNCLVYSEPFHITEDTTVKARFFAFGEYYSDTATSNIELVSPPTATINYKTGYVTLQNPNASGTIYYTTDGSTPTAESTEYVSPFLITNNTTIKMIVVDGDMSSKIATKGFSKTQGGAEYPSYNASTGNGTVVISTLAENGEVHYTTDGSTPTADSPQSPDGYYLMLDYNIFDSQVIKYILLQPGCIPSNVATAKILQSPDAPAISYDEETGIATIALAGNTANIPLQTNDNVPDMGARIYYTLDGSTPTTASTMYMAPFQAQPGDTVKALLVAYGEYESEVAEKAVPNYLYFEAVDAGATIGMAGNMPEPPSLEYSDDGETWHPWTATSEDGVYMFDTITLESAGDRVYLRGENESMGAFDDDEWGDIIASSFLIESGDVLSGGSVMSLLDGVGSSKVITQEYCFTLLFGPDYYEFGGCTGLTQAPNLPATTLAASCYNNMFSGCTGLTQAPNLPATTLAAFCYTVMFSGCTGLTQAPNLPATTLADSCYSNMFSGCTGLTLITCLAEDISATRCTNHWLSGVNATGVFVKAASMSSWTTGVSGIPSGWTVEDYTE